MVIRRLMCVWLHQGGYCVTAVNTFGIVCQDISKTKCIEFVIRTKLVILRIHLIICINRRTTIIIINIIIIVVIIIVTFMLRVCTRVINITIIVISNIMIVIIHVIQRAWCVNLSKVLHIILIPYFIYGLWQKIGKR